MPLQLTKLRPDHDLQCYFQDPAAIAALSGTSATGFTVSGNFRQPFDWAVVEWNRDNVFEHPTLRNLPDGDLSGIQLSYTEARTNCLEMDSTVFDSIGWSALRIWEGEPENFHTVLLRQYATPGGPYTAATVTFTLDGTPSVGDFIELAWLDQHQNYQIAAGDTLATALAGLAGFINANSPSNGVRASASGAQITLTYNQQPGSNGDRVGVYGTISGAQTESWSPASALFAGGVSPAQWVVSLDFGNLMDTTAHRVPTQNVRKVRWTWAANIQLGDFAGGEFAVVITDWQVTGTGTTYSVAGPGSQRVEDNSPQVSYSGMWVLETGNYSAGSIHHSTTNGDGLQVTYTANLTHTLYVGTRYTNIGGQITVQVDSGAPQTVNLNRPLEDVLIRVPVGQFTAGVAHNVTITNSGSTGTDLFFDFLEIAYPTQNLPTFPAIANSTLATDWDTNHSLALAPERTAWLMDVLGFQGRANHYAGALRFYGLYNFGNQYATATITFSGTPVFGGITEVDLSGSLLQHVNLIGDTAGIHRDGFCALDHGGIFGSLGGGFGRDGNPHRTSDGRRRQRNHRHGEHRRHRIYGVGDAWRDCGRRGWGLVHRPERAPAHQPSGARLEHKFLSSAERLWHRHDRVVQHGVGEWRPAREHRDRPDVSGRSGIGQHAGAADEFQSG